MSSLNPVSSYRYESLPLSRTEEGSLLVAPLPPLLLAWTGDFLTFLWNYVGEDEVQNDIKDDKIENENGKEIKMENKQTITTTIPTATTR
jgi:hypothetical protein